MKNYLVKIGVFVVAGCVGAVLSYLAFRSADAGGVDPDGEIPPPPEQPKVPQAADEPEPREGGYRFASPELYRREYQALYNAHAEEGAWEKGRLLVEAWLRDFPEDAFAFALRSPNQQYGWHDYRQLIFADAIKRDAEGAWLRSLEAARKYQSSAAVFDFCTVFAELSPEEGIAFAGELPPGELFDGVRSRLAKAGFAVNPAATVAMVNAASPVEQDGLLEGVLKGFGVSRLTRYNDELPVEKIEQLRSLLEALENEELTGKLREQFPELSLSPEELRALAEEQEWKRRRDHELELISKELNGRLTTEEWGQVISKRSQFAGDPRFRRAVIDEIMHRSRGRGLKVFAGLLEAENSAFSADEISHHLFRWAYNDSHGFANVIVAVENEAIRDVGAGELVKLLAKRGEYANAEEWMETVSGEAKRTKLRGEFASLQVEGLLDAKDFVGSRAAAETHPDPAERAKLLTRAQSREVNWLVYEDRYDEAREVAAEIDDEQRRKEKLGKIFHAEVSAIADAGDFQEARELAEQADSESRRDHLLQMIEEKEARAGRSQEDQ